MIFFGISNMFSDIYECANLRGKKVTKIILNVPELKRERTKSIETRLRELHEQLPIISLDEFIHQEGEEYFVLPTTARKAALVTFLNETYHLQFSQLIHPTAYVSPFATIGQGVFIGANSVISPGVVIMNHVFIQNGVTVGHDTILHDYVRLNPGCNIAGHVQIFDNAIISLGANVIEELVIGKNSVVAAGAVVIRDVKEKTLVAGVPAIVKKIYDRRASDVECHTTI
jgi:sugar O-acyltransferase (sialic acid O-acetyltransferase NeuD family)